MDPYTTLRPETADVFRRLDALGLKQRHLAAAIGIEENKLSKTKIGERQFKAPELLAARDWLEQQEATRSKMPRVQSDTPPTLKSEDGSVPLRHLDLSLSMGDGTTLEDYYEEGVFEFDAALLRRISRAPAYRLIVGQGVGDSMMPTLLNEDMVIFDTTQTVLNAMDKIWAISIYGQGAVKRLRRISADRVLVISDNPTVGSHEYPVEDVRILGRVIWSARRH